MPEIVLFCTVGGSPKPIVSAIEHYQPSRIVFVCSTGPKSSRSQVEGNGNDEGIVARMGIAADAWQILEVPPDDPDTAFIEIERKIVDLASHDSRRIIVDYTGGTKSMSVAAALAALATGVELSLTTGERRDLIKVADGTEQATPIGFRGVMARFALDRAADAWRRFAYGDAAELLERAFRDLTLTGETGESVRKLRQRLRQLLAASRMFEAWDRFAHRDALFRMKESRLANLSGMQRYEQALVILTSDSPEPLMLWDLWLNAERRAHRKRYDDALARLYRLVEWTVQFILRTAHGIETARFDPTVLPEEELRARLTARTGSKGHTAIGLFDALEVAQALVPEHPFVRRLRTALGGSKPLSELQQWIEARNRSILAHGFTPIDEVLWRRAHGWMQQHWVPWIHDELAARSQDLSQFPTEFPT